MGCKDPGDVFVSLELDSWMDYCHTAWLLRHDLRDWGTSDVRKKCVRESD